MDFNRPTVCVTDRWTGVDNAGSSLFIEFCSDVDLHTDTVYYGIEVGVAVQSSGGVGVGARKIGCLPLDTAVNL